MTRRILFTSQKGGVGKSALARSTAVALAARGRKVLLADFDIEQRTCMRWQAQRQARALVPAVMAAPFTSEKKLARVAHDFDDIVIDTGGRHDELSLTLAKAADVTFLPSSFSLDDVLLPTLKVVELLRNAGIPAARVAIVFCRTGGSERQEEQARSVFAMNRIAMLEPMLPQRDGYAALFATGHCAREATSPSLRSIALQLDQALLAFVDAATTGLATRARPGKVPVTPAAEPAKPVQAEAASDNDESDSPDPPRSL